MDKLQSWYAERNAVQSLQRTLNGAPRTPIVTQAECRCIQLYGRLCQDIVVEERKGRSLSLRMLVTRFNRNGDKMSINGSNPNNNTSSNNNNDSNSN